MLLHIIKLSVDALIKPYFLVFGCQADTWMQVGDEFHSFLLGSDVFGEGLVHVEGRPDHVAVDREVDFQFRQIHQAAHRRVLFARPAVRFNFVLKHFFAVGSEPERPASATWIFYNLFIWIDFTQPDLYLFITCVNQFNFKLKNVVVLIWKFVVSIDNNIFTLFNDVTVGCFEFISTDANWS